MKRHIGVLAVSMVLVVSPVAATPLTAVAQGMETWRVGAPVVSARRLAVEVADSLVSAMDAAGAMEVLEARLVVAPGDFDAVWRGAAVALSLGVLTEGETRLAWLRQAVQYGDRLLALRPHDTLSLTWAAATRGRLALEVRGPRAQVRLAKEVWTLTGSLLATAPNDPMGHAIRGKLIQEVCRLSRVERLLARIVGAGDVMDGVTWSEAEGYLERAVALDPGMVLYHLDLGDTYRFQGKGRAAMEVYQRGLDLQERHPVDAYFKRRITDGVRALGSGGGGTR